jgi:hypothetical protein
VTKRTVEVKNCDNDDDIREEDDQTLRGKIVVKNCPCQKRFGKNATRLDALARTIAKQLQTYFQQLYNTKANYKVKVTVQSGNKTHTIFSYTVQVPKAEHGRARAVMKKTCKDEEVM